MSGVAPVPEPHPRAGMRSALHDRRLGEQRASPQQIRPAAHGSWSVCPQDPGELNICSMRVSYPYGTNVVLTARKYFPGQMPDGSLSFEAIAMRLVEIAVCLDVTDRSEAERPLSEVEILDVSPNLSNCNTLISSWTSYNPTLTWYPPIN